ncbi:MAG: peptidylprolyl isomerase [Melioribacteraceae bacterium]|nr:peptidylprolyl isomerase [Melioribacteraceae bacterium]MCF8263254.1 peptidylprolyl isomerase [Melioribacteraceae bacterium]MCF8412875.1 peptidylprolyl isomerase [Melioribacteraceae bacterium]MCF8430694.1 peptidylprolyl isomerase [Melioribacteraceae bacterium]
MAMMAKMRSLAPWFIISVGGLFVLFMVLSDARVADIVGAQSNNVGSINGKDISYQEFSATVENIKNQQEQQNGTEIEESQMDLFRDQVWDLMVDQALVAQKINDLGIKVTDEEITEVILGDNPPQYLRSNFIDSTGNFNRAAYESAIFDPQNKDILIQVEEQIRAQKTQEKLQSIINATVTVSESEVKQDYIDKNIKMSSVFVAVESSSIEDSTIEVTESEIEDYYNEHKSDYEVKEQRKLKYVLFNKKPSNSDSTGIVNNLNSIVTKLDGDTSTFKTYVEIYSDEPYSLDTTAISSLPANAVSKLMAANRNDLIGPLLTGQSYTLYKLVDKIKSDEEFVRASHILIRLGTNDDSVKTVVDGLYDRLIAGEPFAALAKEYSEDPSNAPKGGDLGWFGKGAMVKEFEDASFNGKIDEVQKPIKTRFGYHIIKVTGKSNQKFVVEKIVNNINASPTTVDKIYNRASDFAYLAGENDFTKEAELMKFQISETPSFSENAQSIPGLGSNKGAIRFAFDNSVGSISEVFRVAAGYAVVMVSDITEEGYKPLEEVKNQIEINVRNEKKLDKTFAIAQQISESLGADDDFGKAREIYSKAKVSAASDYTPNGNVTGIGRDYAFNQYSVKGELNKVSPPIKGTRGSYLIKVTRRTEFDENNYNLRKESLKETLLAQKKSTAFRDWLTAIREDADVVDNRHKFFR